MARFAYFITLALSLLTSSVFAAPLGGQNINEKRQIGNLACNVARLKTVAGLAKSSAAIKSAMAAATADPATTAQLQTAAQGISSAQAGVGVIAKALLTGQQAPADARTQVGDGLTTASTALGSTAATDPKVDNAVATASSAVEGTIEAGQQVLANCGN